MTYNNADRVLVAILLAAADLAVGAALPAAVPAHNSTAVPSKLAGIAAGDKAFTDFVTSGQLCSNPNFSELKKATAAANADLLETNDDMNLIIFGGGAFAKPHSLSDMVTNNVPDLDGILNMKLGAVTVSDLLNGKSKLIDILPEFIKKLLPSLTQKGNTPTIESILSQGLGIDLHHLDLKKLLGDKAALLSTINNLNIDSLQSTLSGFKLPAGFTIDTIADKVKGMDVSGFSPDQISGMVDGFDVSAINLKAIGKSMSSYESIADVDIEGILHTVDNKINGPGPMVQVETSGKRTIVFRYHGALNTRGNGIPLKVVRNHARVMDENHNCIVHGANATLILDACQLADGTDQALRMERSNNKLQIEEGNDLFVGVDADGGLVEANNVTDDFQFGLLNLLPTQGNETILEAAMPAIGYLMGGDDEDATGGLSAAMSDMMADLPAAMNVLQVANLTMADVAGAMKDPIAFATDYIPTLTTPKVHAIIDALPAKVADDLSAILGFIDQIPMDYDFARLTDALLVTTTTLWTAADMGDLKRIIHDIPSEIIPESMEMVVGLVDSVEDDITLLEILNIVKSINNHYSLSLELSMGDVQAILKKLPKSISKMLPKGMDKTLKSLPKDITIGQLLRVLKYALSRHWTTLHVSEFNKLMGMIPKKSAPALFAAMGMSLDVDAVSGLLNKFDGDTKLQTLLDLAKSVQKMDFKKITIGELNKFIKSVPQDIITSMLGDMSGMLGMLEKLPGHLRLTKLLRLAKELGATNFHKVTIGGFLKTIGAVSATDLDEVLAGMGMNFRLAPMIGLLSSLDQNMRIADALKLAQTATSLDLHTATIGQLSQLLQSVGPATANGLLKGLATYDQLTAMLGMFPASERVSQILIDAQALVHTLQGDLTKLHVSDVKALVGKWGPLLVQAAGGSLSGALDMAKTVINMLPETATIGEALAPFDGMIGALLNGSFNNAKNMINLLPDMIWDFLKVPKAKIQGALVSLDSDAPLVDVVMTLLNTDIAHLDLPELGDVFFGKLGFDDQIITNLIPSVLTEVMIPGKTPRQRYLDAQKFHGNHHHNLLQWLNDAKKLVKAPWDKTWYEIGQYLKANVTPEIGLMFMGIGHMSFVAYEGLMNKSKPDVSFGSLTAYQSSNYFAAANRDMVPDFKQPLANLFSVANRDMPAAELDAWLPDIDYKLAKGPATSFGVMHKSALDLGGADVLNDAFGVTFGDKLQQASLKDLEQWCTIGSIADEVQMPVMAENVTISISEMINSTASVIANSTMSEISTALPIALSMEVSPNVTDTSSGNTSATVTSTTVITMQSSGASMLSIIPSTAASTTVPLPTTTGLATVEPVTTVAVSVSSTTATMAPTPLPTNYLRKASTVASIAPKMTVASSTASAATATTTTEQTSQASATSTATVSSTANIAASKLALGAEAKTLAAKAEAKKQAEVVEAQKVNEHLEAKKLAEEAEAKKEAEAAEAKKLAEQAKADKLVEKEAQEAEAKKEAQEAEAKKEAQEAEAKKQAQEAEAKKQAQEAEAKKEAQEAEAKEEAQEAEAKKEAQEAEAKKEAQEAEAKKQAEEAEAKKQAEEAKREAEKAEAKKEADEKANEKALEAEALKQFGF